MFPYGNKRVGVSRKNGPRSNVCLKRQLPFVIFFMSYHTNNSMKKILLLDDRVKDIYINTYMKM